MHERKSLMQECLKDSSHFRVDLEPWKNCLRFYLGTDRIAQKPIGILNINGYYDHLLGLIDE